MAKLLIFTLKRDALTPPYLAMLALGWAVSVALASLGGGFAAVVTSINFLTVVASFIAMMASTASTVGDREGLVEAYLSSWGRAGYFWSRAVANLALALAYTLVAITPYFLLRGTPAVFFTLSVSAVASLLGTYIGLISKSRESAFLYSVVAWTGLAIIYDIVVAFINLILPLGSEALLAIQLANPIKLVALTATALVDRHLLTLGPLGEYVIHMGPEWIFVVFSGIYAAWLAALALAIYDNSKKIDL
ncbi:MAG: hypothetical protein ACK4SY_02095 [Pyrobaculum sp.]